MSIDEVLVFSGVIMVLMIISIVTIFILFTKKTIETVKQKEEISSKIQQAIISTQESERNELAINLHDESTIYPQRTEQNANQAGKRRTIVSRCKATKLRRLLTQRRG